MFTILKYKNPLIVNFDRQNNKLQSVKSLDELSNIKSIQRSRTMISDIVLCNNFDLFATFTFDPKKTDRQNPEICKMRMSRWLNGQRRRSSPDLAYLIVPEAHADGALHFHALMKNFNGRLKDSTRKTKTNRPIYNFSGYRWGFSTAVKIQQNNHDQVANYVKKYITKNIPRFSNKKRYWTSTNLIRPIKTTNSNISALTTKSSLVYDNEYFEKYIIPKLDEITF